MRSAFAPRAALAAALLAAAALILPPVAGGAGPPAGFDGLRDAAEGLVRADWNEGSGRIRTLRGRLTPPSAQSPEEVAARFLGERGALLGLEEGGGGLSLVSVRQSPGGTRLVYRQTLGGLPVFNAGVDVNLDGEGRVRVVHNRYVPAAAPDATPAVPLEAGVAAAAEDLLGSLPRGGEAAPLAARRGPAPPSEAELGVFLVGETPRLAWRFVLETKEPFAVVEYTVDARGGGVLRRRDLVARLVQDGTGTVFDPNPVNTLTDPSLTDATDPAAFAGAYRAVTLRDLSCNSRGRRFRLRGPYVFVTDGKERPRFFRRTRGRIVSRYGDFNFTRGSRKFEHVMCYFHIDRNQRYLQGLGFEINQRPILVDPHGPYSYYVGSPPGAGYLAFGSAGVDDAEDADVIIHEYAHAIQDNSAPGYYIGAGAEARAMVQGFADYWAASSTYDVSVANGFDPACIGEWDAAPGCLRRVDGSKTFADVVGDEHADGEIWAAALWDLFLATGDRGATDSIVLRSHFLVPPDPTFLDGAEALLAADELLYGGFYQADICSVMASRELRPDGCQFIATLTWDNIFVDLDLHLRPPDGAGYLDWDYDNDCYHHNRNPDWGTEGNPTDDPLLKFDCRFTPVRGCHDEQIVLGKFTTPGPYEVLVHFYKFEWNPGWPDEQTTTAEVNVYRGGTLISSGTRTLANPGNDPWTGEVWSVHTIDITAP